MILAGLVQRGPTQSLPSFYEALGVADAATRTAWAAYATHLLETDPLSQVGSKSY